MSVHAWDMSSLCRSDACDRQICLRCLFAIESLRAKYLDARGPRGGCTFRKLGVPAPHACRLRLHLGSSIFRGLARDF